MASFSKSGLYWQCTPPFDTTKPSLVFLHASWMSLSMFDETVDHLSALLPNVNLIRIDLNGHGKTTRGRKEFTLWDQGEDVIALMDELEISQAILVGISMGSGIALRMALAYPSRIKALVLMASTADAPTAEGIAAINQVRDIWVSTPSPSEDIMNIAICGWGGDPDVTSPRAQSVKRHWVKRHSGAENINAILQSMNHQEDLFHRLREITVPSLLVHGEKDQTWDLEGALRIRDALGNADVKMHIVKDSGHLLLYMRDSEDVSQVIAEFVQEVLR